MNVITALTNPVWRDTGVNVEVHGGNGRFEIRWPTLFGTSGAPDFTTRTDAFRYAQHVATAIRTNRHVAHMAALREDATRTTTLDLVLRGKDGDCWIRVGSDRYALSSDVYRGEKYVERWATTRAELEAEDGAPLTVEHSIEIRGEVVA